MLALTGIEVLNGPTAGARIVRNQLSGSEPACKVGEIAVGFKRQHLIQPPFPEMGREPAFLKAEKVRKVAILERHNLIYMRVIPQNIYGACGSNGRDVGIWKRPPERSKEGRRHQRIADR